VTSKSIRRINRCKLKFVLSSSQSNISMTIVLLQLFLETAHGLRSFATVATYSLLDKVSPLQKFCLLRANFEHRKKQGRLFYDTTLKKADVSAIVLGAIYL